MDIYRFVSFFELYELVINKKLKFSQLKLMNDENEGLTQALKSLVTPDSLGLNIMSPSNSKDIIDYQKKIQNSTYITCWTKEKNSMAMWLLYSKNKDSIRIKTSIKKLKFYTHNYINKNNYDNVLKSRQGTMQILPFNNVHYIDDVEYNDLAELTVKLKELYKQQKEEFLSGKLDNVDTYKECVDSYYQKGNELINNSLFLKDNAYKFEEEVRAVLNVVARNKTTYNEWKEIKDSVPRWEKEFLLPTVDFEYDTELFTNIIYIDVEDDFIEEICFDPRMPEYQQNIYKNILGTSMTYTTSNVFGHLSESIKLSNN